MVIEKRKFPRLELEDITAKLFKRENKEEIDFCPINVSREGFSIFTSTPLAVGSQLVLSLYAKDVILEVCWCKAKEDDQAVFRCGLKTVDPKDELDILIKEDLSF